MSARKLNLAKDKPWTRDYRKDSSAPNPYVRQTSYHSPSPDQSASTASNPSCCAQLQQPNRIAFVQERYTNPANCQRTENTAGHFGGYQAERVRKLRSQAVEARTGIFKGITVYFNGFLGSTHSDLTIKEMLQENGGSYTPFFSKTTVTHMICTSLANSKILKLTSTKKISSQFVVHPDWLVDSVKAGKRLPESKYQLFAQKDQPRATSFWVSSPLDSPTSKCETGKPAI
ncbi:BRCT domain-containing protein [Cladochytrium replicatum]|nr:BRCT domain-containing protein [Cladochytrium replicatum]